MRKSRAFCLLVCFLAVLPCHGLERQPAAEYRARRVALAAKLEGGAALLFAAPQAQLDLTPYRQDEDFYYLTGWNEPGAALLVEADSSDTTPASPNGNVQPATSIGYKEILFLPARNLRMERYTGVKLDAASVDAPRIAGVDEVRPMAELPGELVRITHGDGTTAYYSKRLQHLSTQTDLPPAQAAFSMLGASLGMNQSPVTTDVRALTMQLRQVKSAGEIALLKKAADASVAAHRAVMKAVKPETGENEIEGLFYQELRKNHCERPSYASIVGSGPNATTLHYSADDRVMESGDVVVIDAAGEYSMYASDVTRTLPVNGKFTDRQREIYNIVLEAQRAAASAFVSGKSVLVSLKGRGPEVQDSLDKVAYDYINTHGKDLHGEPLGKYFIHGVGHSVGIDVHDPYEFTKPLGPGSVFTIEPGIYLPEEKIGVRIEDTFYVSADGKLINMSADLPHTADEVEAAMR